MHLRNAYLPPVALIVLAGPLFAQNWPSFRGPSGSGISTGDPPVEWSVLSGKNITWKTRIPGLAHSSPVVWGDRVFVTTAVSSRAESPELKTGWVNGSGDPANDSGTWTWKVICLDRGSGRVLWEREACSGLPKIRRHMKGSQANCTPATDGEHVVAFFGSEGLYCFTAGGELLWKKDLGTFQAGPYDAPGLQWGVASSPVIYGNKVILQCDALNGAFWASYDLASGRELLRVKRDEVTTWSTPAVIESAGRSQVVLNGWKHMGGYDLETGRELWSLSGGGDIPAPTPQYAQGLIFLTNGHGRSPIYAIRPDARGDLTPRGDGKKLPEGLAWWSPKGGSYIPTPIVLGGIFYIPNDNGIIAAIDAKSGKEYYHVRLPEAGTFSASVVAASDHLYFLSEEGDMFVIKAGEKFELLARNPMNEVCMATPAISGGRMFIRGRDHLYCVGR